jgi:hypothetical protein
MTRYELFKRGSGLSGETYWPVRTFEVERPPFTWDGLIENLLKEHPSEFEVNGKYVLKAIDPHGGLCVFTLENNPNIQIL